MSLPPNWKDDPTSATRAYLETQRPTYVELTAKLAEVTYSLNMARLVMDSEGRKLAGEIVDEALAMVKQAREGQ